MLGTILYTGGRRPRHFNVSLSPMHAAVAPDTILHVKIASLNAANGSDDDVGDFRASCGHSNACKTVGRAGTQRYREAIVSYSNGDGDVVDRRVRSQTFGYSNRIGYIFASYLIFNEIYFCSFFDRITFEQITN
ncbi:hypothetical protein Trydic_g9751 [Trypoxylus dichotomus]